MALIATASITKVATEIARALVRVTTQGDSARLSLPLLYPGGSGVSVEISKLRDSFLVSDTGNARREASFLGGERVFLRLASEVAGRYGVRFDRNMFFEMEVTTEELLVVVIAVANAAKAAVENTAMHLAAVEHADYRATLWERLDRLFKVSNGTTKVERKVKLRGSSDKWEFDASVQRDSKLSLFEIVVPNANAVNSAVTKFLDVRDLGKSAPARIAVLTDRERTPHLPVLARTAKWIPIDASDEAFRRAA